MTKRTLLLSLLYGIIALTGCTDCKYVDNTQKTRVGIYDSRAVAIAYAHSDWNEKRLESKVEEMEQAKAAGDKKKIKELDEWGKAQQAKLHRQGFGTAPVDDILEHIKEELAQIAKDANVIAFVSKWDKKTLKRYKSAELVDVTDLIVAQFNPNERTLKTIEQLKDKKPIPLWQLETMMKLEKH